MIYSITKCPHCGKTERRTNPSQEIGMPFEICSNCKNIRINPYKEEWITKSPMKRNLFFIQNGVYARAIVVPLITLSILGASGVLGDMEGSTVFIILFILAVTWLIVGYFVHKNAAKESIAESLERTDDVLYLCALKKAGYTIYPLENTKDINDKLYDIMNDDNINSIINNIIYDMALNESFKKNK